MLSLLKKNRISGIEYVAESREEEAHMELNGGHLSERSRVSQKKERGRFVGKEDKINSNLPLVALVMQGVREGPGLR